jgi:hypothetical protein
VQPGRGAKKKKAQDAAFQYLDEDYEQRSGLKVFIKSDPFWDNMRSDPRNLDLLRRMDLPP